MSVPPPVVVLDVNETLSDLAPLGARFESIGAPAALMGTWFAGVLRDGFADLDLHPDVEPGLRAMRRAGLRVVTLSNGAAGVAERLLTRAGVRHLAEQVLTVEDVGVWKPARAAYQYAAERCAVDATSMLMVAVHPWDRHGAARAGLRTAWINRRGREYRGAPGGPVTGPARRRGMRPEPIGFRIRRAATRPDHRGRAEPGRGPPV